MKLSIIIAVLNSHEIVRRQFLFWSKMQLPDGVEFILVDDGSDPPILYPEIPVKNLTIHQTNDFRPWTVSLARNKGAELAKGEYIIMTDIDHILVQETILQAYEFTGDRRYFQRYFGFLTEDGNFSQDGKTLLEYGLTKEFQRRNFKAPVHGDSFLMRKELFFKAGGYRLDDIIKYPPMGETHFRAAYRALQESGQVTTDEFKPNIYLIPNGYYCGDVDANPFGLFHTLTRERNKYIK